MAIGPYAQCQKSSRTQSRLPSTRYSNFGAAVNRQSIRMMFYYAKTVCPSSETISSCCCDDYQKLPVLGNGITEMKYPLLVTPTRNTT